MQFLHGVGRMKGEASSAGTLLGSYLPRNRLGSTWLSKTGVRWQSVVDKSPLLTFAARHVGELIVVAAFIAVSAALFVMGDGLPYVTDNNETFSSLNHAYNLWHFDFFRSYGLADEAASPYAAAHPVVHSHQGNFPRLFAFLIYVLGSRSAESQILVTTLTIGVASILMAYTFFRRLAGDLFATVALLVFVTDYIMFAQWQVNTYRVWHTFFFFGTLLCVNGYAEWRPRNWALATFFLYVGLFYWELVFAVFTGLTAAFYTLWVYRHRWRAILVSGCVQGAGAVCGLAIVITQLALYLGWDGFVQDLTLTLTARNYAPDDQHFLQILRTFYENRNIAFFYNVQSADSHSGFIAFLRSLTFNVFQVPTPLLTLLALTLTIAVFASDSRLPGPRDTRDQPANTWIASTACLALGAFVLLIAISDDGRGVLGGAWSGLSGSFWLVLLQGTVLGLLATGLALCLRAASQRLSLVGALPSLDRSIRAGLYFCVLGFFIANQGWLYNRADAALWLNALTPVSAGPARVLVLTAAVLGSLIILTGRRATLGRWHAIPASIAPFLICAGLAYVSIFKLSAGYLYTGYLYRLCTMPVFFCDVLLALGVFSALASATTLAARSLGQFHRRSLFATALGAGATGLAIVAIWGTVQLRYVRLLPPDQFSFVKKLEPPQLDGDGIVSNTYATPFGIAARTWAYTRILDNGAATVPSDPKTAADNLYVWLADRHSNAKYWRPAYYVCFFQIATLSSLRESLPEEKRCSKLDIVKRAIYESGQGVAPKPEVVARDMVGDHWAILRLKWPTAVSQKSMAP
jgi:hypothetical protein